MPRVTKKDRRLARCERMSVNDVTLSDFANATMSNPSAHARKCVVNVHLDSHNISKVSNLGTEDLSWFEKDLDDFEIIAEAKDEEEEEEENSENVKNVKPKKSFRLKKRKQLQSVVKEGIDYPDDVWYQLSHYIYPESVSTFSRLCKATYRIANTISFWRHLYRRFYNKKLKLPKFLQPLCLERIHGLQANVVRALFQSYPPFIERLSSKGPFFEDEPHKLVGRRCLLLWYQPVKNLWNFSFKLVNPSLRQQTFSVYSQREFMDQYDNISYNTEEGCSILQVTCTHFLSVPIIMGLVLNRVYLTVGGQGMRYQTLRLMFDSRYHHETFLTGTTVTLDSVVNIRVIPWWDPKYPFST